MTTDVTAGTPSQGPGLMSSSGSPAASPPTRPASCCAGSPSPATTSPSCPTAAALRFVGAATWAALSGKPSRPRSGTTCTRCRTCGSARPPTSSWSRPATADLLAKAAHGLADDLLTNTLLTARCPVVFAPAMHTEMWEHAATAANVATLREPRRPGHRAGRGPAHRRRHRQGPAARARRDLRGLPRGAGARRRPRPTWPAAHVVVCAGGTREYLDPVRFLGNRSSGLQGYALAADGRRPRRRGHPGRRQRLAARPGRASRWSGSRRPPSCATPCVGAAAGADAVVMAAAPADFRPVATSARPRSRRPPTAARRPSSSTQNPDILARARRTDRVRPGAVIVGFAAETGDDTGVGARPRPRQAGPQGLRPARRQRRQRGRGLRQRPTTQAVILAADGAAVDVPRGSKAALAHVIWDQVAGPDRR